jgi:hypothetical protein
MSPATRSWRAALRWAAVGIFAVGLFTHYSARAQDTSPTLEIVHPKDGGIGENVQVVMILKDGDPDDAFISFPAPPSKLQVSKQVIVATFEVPDAPGAQMLLGAKVVLADGTFLFAFVTATISD